MKHLAIKLVRFLPRLQRLLDERNDLRADCHELDRKQIAYRSHLAALDRERASLTNELSRIASEFAHVQAERERASAELAAALAERKETVAETSALRACASVLPGHPSSPIPSLEELKRRENEIWRQPPEELPAVTLNASGQLHLLRVFENFYREAPSFPALQGPEWRYYHDNGYFPLGDALTLYCMLRYLRPRRVIEVGSGHSSCVTLDVNDRFFGNAIACTFIEPYPQRLRSLLRPQDQIELIEKPLQDVDLDLFRQLGPRDILFLDSTHAAKCGGDVNRIFFEILPALGSGVFVHVHDIHYPFEYPKVWVYQGMHWNEDYLLHAFLQYNRAFSIQFWYRYLYDVHRAAFAGKEPECLRHGGSCFWLRKA